MSSLLQLDFFLFDLINQQWQNGLFDAILPCWRNKLFWVPLYVFLASFLLLNFGKKGILVIVFSLLTIVIADLSSSKLFKPWVQRVRPCQSELMENNVHLLVSCGSGFSFPSSHATNHFALAVFLGIVLGRFIPYLRWILLFWAFSIAYGQVYVGVHYPIDVFAGAILGSLIGKVVAWVADRWLGGLGEDYVQLQAIND